MVTCTHFVLEINVLFFSRYKIAPMLFKRPAIVEKTSKKNMMLPKRILFYIYLDWITVFRIKKLKSCNEAGWFETRKLVGSQCHRLTSHNFWARSSQLVGTQLANRCLATCKFAGVYTSSTGHLILWFLFCSFFSLLLLFNVNQMILKDINIEKIFWIFTTFVRRIFRETHIEN